MPHLFKVSFILVVAVCLTACSRQEKVVEAVVENGGVVTNMVSRLLQDLSPDDPLVIVNGAILTRRAHEELIQEDLAIAYAKNPTISAKERDVLWNTFNEKNVFLFINRQVMISEAKSLGIEVTDDDWAAANKFIDKICSTRKISRENYIKCFSEGEIAVNRRIQEEALLRALFRKQFGNSLTITREEALVVQKNLEVSNQIALEKNAERKNRLEDIRNHFLSGKLEFDENGNLILENLSDVFCETIDKSDLDLNKLEDQIVIDLKNICPNQTTGISDNDENFEFFIYTVNTNFVRVFVEKDLGYIVPSLAEIKRDFEWLRREQYQKPWIEGLLKKAAIVYPNGVDWFSKK